MPVPGSIFRNSGQGKEDGLRLAKEIFALRDAGLSIPEIASRVQLSAEDIKKLLF